MPWIEMIVYGVMLVGAIHATWSWKHYQLRRPSNELTVPFTITLRNTRPPGAASDTTGEQTEW